MCGIMKKDINFAAGGGLAGHFLRKISDDGDGKKKDKVKLPMDGLTPRRSLFNEWLGG